MNRELYQVMPPLADDQYEMLKASIAENGVLVPVEMDENGNTLDGHHRRQICEELGILDYPCIVRSGLNEDEKRIHARCMNLARRHLNKLDRDKLIADQLRETPSISDRAIAARLGVHHTTVSTRRKNLVQRGEISHVDEVIDTLGRTQKRPAPAYVDNTPEGRSSAISRAKEIRSENRALIREIRTGKINEIAAKGSGQCAALPRGQYPILYCDWPWENDGVRDAETGNDKSPPYPTLPVSEALSLCAGDKSPATPDAAIFFWVTNNRLDDGIDIIRSWGFDYVTSYAWGKEGETDGMGMGFWVRDCHEILLIGKRGNMLPPDQTTLERSLYWKRKGEHSAKPEMFARIIDSQWPDLPKLELFQRAKSLKKDDIRLHRRKQGRWSFWGNEASQTQEEMEKGYE